MRRCPVCNTLDETSKQEEGTMRHICPVCGSGHIKTDWEATDDNQNWWYTGHYVCLKCLTIYRASGSIRMGEPVVHAWHPACSRHGTDAVVVSEQDNQHFYCVKCGRRMAVVDKQIQTVWKPYQPIFPEHPVNLVEPVMQRIGGLPHD